MSARYPSLTLRDWRLPMVRLGCDRCDSRRVLEPLIGHGDDAMPGGKDHVEEILALEDLAEPALVLDLDDVTETLEVIEDTRVVARLAQDVEVLGRARDAGIGAERIGAGQQERRTELCEFVQRLGVECFGVLRRWRIPNWSRPATFGNRSEEPVESGSEAGAGTERISQAFPREAKYMGGRVLSRAWPSQCAAIAADTRRSILCSLLLPSRHRCRRIPRSLWW
jgi:hypothetical protein